MVHAFSARTAAMALLTATVALGLSGCGGETEKMEYQTDVEDKSGGELIVEDANQEGVDVDLPETPMTNVPEEDVPAGD